MRSMVARLVLFGGVVAATTASAQTRPPRPGTDVYHVHFAKAAPGQAAALGKSLMVPDKTSPMPAHFVVLRHQEGDDWDYVGDPAPWPEGRSHGDGAASDGRAARPHRLAQRYVRERTVVGGVHKGNGNWRIGERVERRCTSSAFTPRPRSSRATPEIAERSWRREQDPDRQRPADSTSKAPIGRLRRLPGTTRGRIRRAIAVAAAAAGDATAGGWADIRQHSGVPSRHDRRSNLSGQVDEGRQKCQGCQRCQECLRS